MSTTSTLTPSFDGMDKCPSRFTAICFTCGRVPDQIPAEDLPKVIWRNENGTDIVFRLVSSVTDPTSTDFVSGVRVTIPLGSASNDLLAVAPGMYDARMLNNLRFLAIIREAAGAVVVELRPKSVTRLTPLVHNLDLSFVIKGTALNKGAANVSISIVELYTSEEGNSMVALNQIHPVQVQIDI